MQIVHHRNPGRLPESNGRAERGVASRRIYTRKLAETGSYIALPEHHRLATEDRVRLSDLKGEFFVSWDRQQAPGLDRQVEAYCKRYGRFRPKFHCPVAKDQTILRVGRQRKMRFLSCLPSPAIILRPGPSFYPWRTRRWLGSFWSCGGEAEQVVL